MSDTTSPEKAQQIISRGITMEADAAWMENPMKKEGRVRGFTVFSDEPEEFGGTGTAPPPLAYFTIALGF